MNNIKCDNHIHSKFSFDSRTSLNDIVSKAEELNLKYIALTDHVEFANQPVKDVIHSLKIRNKIIDDLQENTSVKIIKGVEISEPHLYRNECERITEALDLDYVIGSIHHILGMPIRKMTNYKNVYDLYLKSMLKMVESAKIDTLAHLDYLKRYLVSGEFDKDVLREILNIIIERKIALEINTSGVRRCNEPFPSNDILDLYQSLGGKNVIYGSDAHTTDEMYNNVPEVKENNEHYNFNEGIVLKRKYHIL